MDNILEKLQTIASDFEEFKKANDEKLENIAKGHADPLVDEKVARIEAKLDSYEDANQQQTAILKQQEQITETLDSLKTQLERPNSGFSTKQVDEAYAAFDTWIRKGDRGMSELEQKALTVSNDSTGGFLAPPEYVREIIKTVTEISPIRSIARVRTTAQRSVQIPRRTGQFAAQWVSEIATRSETTGYTVGLEDIPAHEYYARVDISEQDLEDTVFDLEAEMQSEFAEQFAKAEGTAFVSGDAVGKPEGILTNSDVTSVNSGNGTALTADGLITLAHSIKSEYARNATFVFNRATLAAIRKLKDGNGQYIFQAGMTLEGGMVNTILGFPYVQATDMPDVGAGTKPIAFGDFRRAYTIVDRVQLSVLRDPFTLASAGQVQYIARRRVGGQVVLAEAIVKQNVSA